MIWRNRREIFIERANDARAQNFQKREGKKPQMKRINVL